MTPPSLVTTSWDDGHPLDLRVAELLARYDLTGTFYVPRRAERRTLKPAELRDLASHFEIGAHTLDHVDLNRVDPERARQEIIESKAHLEDILGKPCSMFCFPMGRFRREHIAFVQEAGYVAARTTELLSLEAPRLIAGVRLMPTSVQAFEHSAVAYARNLGKRRGLAGLWHTVVHGGHRGWLQIAASLLTRVVEQGGVFHAWGHSWEIEEWHEWRRLEEVFRLIREVAPHVPCVSNGEVVQRTASNEPYR